MRSKWVWFGVVALAAILATTASAQNRGVTFKAIGFIDDPGPFPASPVLDMNADGSMLVTSPSWSGSYCTLTDPVTLEWTLVGGTYGNCKISADGSMVMASVPAAEGYTRTGIWNGTADDWTMVPVPDGFEACGTSGHSFFDMGGNAEFATGLTWEGCSIARAYRWDAATNTSVNLGSLNDDDGRGNAISDDGSTIGGWGRMLCGPWRGARWDDGNWSWVDGQGNIEPKSCVSSGGGCCSNYDCPEFVDDASCDNHGACDLEGIECAGGVCTGGPNAGQACSGYWNCPGYCASGPNAGGQCTSDYSCPGSCVGGPDNGMECTSDYSCTDTPACVENPAWDPMQYKGEVADVTADGRYLVGYQYGDWIESDPYLQASAYRANPDGSFTQIPPPEGASPYDSWTPFAISDDGGTVVGRYGWWIFSYPVLWTEETGTLDFQWFLVGQGLDELWYWYLSDLTSVSADGTKVAGHGANPDWWTEGFVVDLTKAKICHAPPGNPENRRTITVNWDSLGDHIAHGDQLATCEFIESGARSRSLERRPVRPSGDQVGQSADFNPVFRSKDDMIRMREAAGAPPMAGAPEARRESETSAREAFMDRERETRTKGPRRR